MKLKYHIYGALVGIVVGFISAKALFVGPVIAISCWGIIGLVLGWFAPNTEVRTLGVHYGFMLILSFMWFTFGGTHVKILGYLGLSLVFAIVGMFAGWLASFVGHKIKLVIKKD